MDSSGACIVAVPVVSKDRGLRHALMWVPIGIPIPVGMIPIGNG